MASASVAYAAPDDELETSLLITRLALEDIEDITKGKKGKSRAGAPLSDEEHALVLQSDMLTVRLRMLEDAILARSIGEAIRSDQEYIYTLSVMEQAEFDDHRAAEELSNGRPLPPLSESQRLLDEPDFSSAIPKAEQAVPDESLGIELIVPSYKSPNRTAFTAYRDNPGHIQNFEDDYDDDDSEPGESSQYYFPVKRLTSSSNVAGSSGTKFKKIECVICGDQIRKSMSQAEAPCGHAYCRSCLRNLVETLTRDESLYPLRCCQQPIDTKSVLHLLPVSLRILFESKIIEFGTPSLNRVYCPSPNCSSFLGSSEGVTGNIQCPHCDSLACSLCRQAAHVGEECREILALSQLKELARTERWQTCPGCNAIVELQVGCYHMTCRCRTQFCYLCAVPWKNCSCEQWDNNRLLITAERRVVNEMGQAAANRAPAHIFERRVEEMARTLQDNHNCVAHSWRRRSGGGRCEECRFTLPDYLMVCRHCALLACLRCSRNRL